MAISRMWVFLIVIVSLAEITVTDSAKSECHIDARDAIAGEAFIIGTWSLNNATLSVTVIKNNSIRFSFSFDGNVEKLSKDRQGRLVLKVDNITTEVSLMFEIVGKEDGGQYGMKIFFRRNQRDRCWRKDGEYILQLNVIEQTELIQGCEGDNIFMELEATTESYLLYRYDKTVATVMESGCWVSDESVYGRIRCTSKNGSYVISINNVTQRDTGLYIIQDPMNNSSIQKWFVNISDKPIHANIGDNFVIGWFYKQPGNNCPIRVIHPYEGAIIMVPSNNVAQIKNDVRHRLLYSGDVSRNYMAFTLLNVIGSDAGYYRIESLYETIIHGRKQLIVEDNITTTGLNSESIDTSLTDLPLNYDSSYIPKSEKEIVNMPVFGIAVAIGVVVVILLMIGCQIRNQQKNIHSLEEVQRIVLEKCDTVSFATPSTIRRHLPSPPMHAQRTGHWLQVPNSDQSGIGGLQYAAIPMNLVRDYKECNGIVSLEKMVYNKPGLVLTHRIENCDTLILASNNNISDSYCKDNEDILEEHLFSAGNSEQNLIDDGNRQREKEPNIHTEDLYAEAKMINIFASETKQTWNLHENLVGGTSDEGEYEVFEGVIKTTSEKANKIADGRDLVMVKTKGPKDETMTSNAEFNDYEDISL
ncbi:hypothetical protein CHS0354_012805 [Potamilus streckersoni]|uniref:Uncharacterized protein n=1 Tax=Potamilus streckersoni TaxID=2493646 RepID=A0AAE0SWG8_9BIVA|nr:hypothetical protein CHS0354_012805 [Potamilus streckersoni]